MRSRPGPPCGTPRASAAPAGGEPRRDTRRRIGDGCGDGAPRSPRRRQPAAGGRCVMSVPNEPELSWAELDQLADYAAGALTGAPASRVADLLRTDDRWAAAYAALSAAEPFVQS